VFTETLLELLGPDGEIFVIEPTRCGPTWTYCLTPWCQTATAMRT
jgi:hypothetical protein